MTADLAIIAMAVVTLTSTVLDHRHQMKVADRERLVGPAKQPAQPTPRTRPRPKALRPASSVVPGSRTQHEPLHRQPLYPA